MAKALPILQWVPGYQLSWVRVDLVAGLTVTAILVPETKLDSFIHPWALRQAHEDLRGWPTRSWLGRARGGDLRCADRPVALCDLR